VPAIVTFIIGYLTGEFLEQAVVESISGQPHRSSSTHPNVPDSLPELTSVEAVRSGLTQAEACGLHPAHGQLE
jgi:hypothetical protein